MIGFWLRRGSWADRGWGESQELKVKSLKSKAKVKSATASLREALRGGSALLAALVGRPAVCFLGAVLFPSVAASALRVQHAARGVNFNPLR